MRTDLRKAALTSKLVEMEKRLAALTRDITKTLSSDFAEQATERENDDVLEEIAKETKLSIAHLKAALQRIDDENYGRCGSCGEDIAEARLDALPESTMCVGCAP
jgi:DnaK suppressor protein